MQIKLIQSTSKCREQKKKYFSKAMTKGKKIIITLSKLFKNLINSNCKKSSNLLIIKNCQFFECIVNSTFTWCDYCLSFGVRAVPHIRDNICPLLSRICAPEICGNLENTTDNDRLSASFE